MAGKLKVYAQCGKEFMMNHKTGKKAAAIVAGAVLFFLTGRFVLIEGLAGAGDLSAQFGILAFIAALSGPVAGALAGLAGQMLIDISFGWGIWWDTAVSAACFGLLAGVFTGNLKLHKGQFGLKSIVVFNAAQICAHAISWGIICPALKVLIYAQPAGDSFRNGLSLGIVPIITTALIGTILCMVYAGSQLSESVV